MFSCFRGFRPGGRFLAPLQLQQSEAFPAKYSSFEFYFCFFQFLTQGRARHSRARWDLQVIQQEFFQLGKPAPGAAHLAAAAVEQAGRQQEGTHAQHFGGADVLVHIIAHHDAVFRLRAQLLQQILIVCGVWLAEAAVLVGGDELKILRLQSGPADALAGGDGGEKGAGKTAGRIPCP